jgi:hypothetical protein
MIVQNTIGCKQIPGVIVRMVFWSLDPMENYCTEREEKNLDHTGVNKRRLSIILVNL